MVVLVGQLAQREAEHRRGRRGRPRAGNLEGVSGENIVALCDIDKDNLAELPSSSQGETYSDFRKMLDEIGKQVEAVVVSTPDHTHAPAGAMALAMASTATVRSL